MLERFHALVSDFDVVTIWSRLLAVLVVIGVAYVLTALLRKRFPQSKVFLANARKMVCCFRYSP